MGNVISLPLRETEPIKELITISEQPYVKVDIKDFVNMLKYISEIEQRLDEAEENIQLMKNSINTLEYNAEHPIKATYDKTVDTAQSKLQETKNSLNNIKNKIIEGSKNAVSEFKNKGTVALNNFINCFQIKEDLENFKKGLNKDIASSEKTVDKIEKISSEYHEAGKHLKNYGRAIMGKESVDTAKESGYLSKAFKSPYKANIAILNKAVKSAESAIESLERLDEKAINITKPTEKQSVIKQIAANKEKSREQPVKKTNEAICL